MQRSTLHIKLLPKKAAKTLRLALDELYVQLHKTSDISNSNTSTEEDVEILLQRRKREVIALKQCNYIGGKCF